MAAKKGSRSPGSLIVEIIVIALLAVLFLALFVPRRQWREQDENMERCRQRIENLDRAVRFFNKHTKSFPTNIDDLIALASAESLTVYPPGFKPERITREDSGIDSFRIDYLDPYPLFNHFLDSIQFHYPADSDSVVLTIKPKPRFAFLPETKYTYKAVEHSKPLTISDLKDEAAFVEVFRKSDDDVTSHIRSQFSPVTSRLLDEYTTAIPEMDLEWFERLDSLDKPDADELWRTHITTLHKARYDSLLQGIVNDINIQMRENSLYNAELFASANLPESILENIGKELEEFEDFSLNRRILEATFPNLVSVCPKPIIHVELANLGEEGYCLYLGSQGRMRTKHLLGETIRARAAEFIYDIDTQDMKMCPASHQEYKFEINVKLATLANMNCTLEKTAPETSLASSERLASLVMYRILKESDALAKRELVKEKTFEIIEDSLLRVADQAYLDSFAEKLINEGLIELSQAIYDSVLIEGRLIDSTQIARWETIRDSSYIYSNRKKADPAFQQEVSEIVNEIKDARSSVIFQTKLTTLRKEKEIIVSESGIITTTTDSIDFYSDQQLIRDRLFAARTDSVTMSYLSRPDVQELFKMFNFSESYGIGKIDTVGVTISCPIEGTYHKRDKSILEKIFAVDGEKNHGRAENGDLSWSERR